jgi:demethylmenaquinone methyltransferase/2-methoxy-6-polyprenyl-1,4-benzoquinol methylase
MEPGKSMRLSIHTNESRDRSLQTIPDPAASAEPCRRRTSRDGDAIRRMFAAISPRYDLLNHLLSAGVDVSWRRAAVRALALAPGDAVIDLCTGTGDLALAAAKALDRLGAGTVTGSDFTPEMLRIAATKRERRRARGLSLVLADTLDLPFADCTFDAAAVAFGIRNVADLGRGVGEIFRVLKPGGRAAILEFSARKGGVLHRAFEFYFRRLLPRLGGWISGTPAGGDAYAYLPASVLEFPAPPEFTRLLEAHGFTGVQFQPLTLGIATIHTARRP